MKSMKSMKMMAEGLGGKPTEGFNMELPRHLPMASPYGLLRRLHHASRHSVFFAGKERQVLGSTE